MGMLLLGHRYYDSSTGRFLTRDPIKDGRNWYVYCDNNPVDGADQESTIHIVVSIGPDGLGTGKEFADKDDIIQDIDGSYMLAEGGELIRELPVSNRPAGKHERQPNGTRKLTGIEHKPYRGKNYPVTRGKDGGEAGRRGTWLHSYNK